MPCQFFPNSFSTQLEDTKRCLLCRVNSFPILFQPSLKTLNVASKSSQLPQKCSAFSWALSKEGPWVKFTNTQSYRKLKIAHRHWQWFCFLWINKKNQIWGLHFLSHSLSFWKSGKQNHVWGNATEAEFHAVLERSQKLNSCKTSSSLSTKVTKIFNCKNTLILCDGSSARNIAS